MASLKSLWAQFYPSKKPTFTEEHVGNQAGRVFVVTGSNCGVGYEIVKLLYPSGAKVYLACRSEERAMQAIESIKSLLTPRTPSTLEFLHLDLNDLISVKKAAETFASREIRLDVLWNNAAYASMKGATTAQGLEGNVGINCVGPFLLTLQLVPHLKAAAKINGESRIVWSSSSLTDHSSPPGGLDFKVINSGKTVNPNNDLAVSKVGNIFLSIEAANRWGKDGVLSVAQNPGNLKTNIYRSQNKIAMTLVSPIILHPSKLGGYTSLYSGLSKDISAKNNGVYIWPWGIIVKEHARPDINQAVQDGKAVIFWEWCEDKVKPFV